MIECPKSNNPLIQSFGSILFSFVFPFVLFSSSDLSDRGLLSFLPDVLVFILFNWIVYLFMSNSSPFLMHSSSLLPGLFIYLKPPGVFNQSFLTFPAVLGSLLLFLLFPVPINMFFCFILFELSLFTCTVVLPVFW